MSCPRILTRPPIEALIERADAGVLLPPRPPAGHTIVLTSGTTGTPKGARRPAPRSMAPAATILSAIPLRAGEPVLIAAPLIHTWGLGGLQLAVLHGAPAVLPARFDPAALLAVAERERCDAVIVVPVMLQRVLELPGRARRGLADPPPADRRGQRVGTARRAGRGVHGPVRRGRLRRLRLHRGLLGQHRRTGGPAGRAG